MSVELHTRTRRSLRPDPECDPVLAIFYYVHHDRPHSGTAWGQKQEIQGVIAIDIVNAGFQAIDISRQKNGKALPRKQPIRSPRKSVTPMKNSTDTASNAPTNQIRDSGRNLGIDCGGQQGPLNPTSVGVAKGYLSGSVSGEGVEVRYVSSETELFDKLITTVRRYTTQEEG